VIVRWPALVERPQDANGRDAQVPLPPRPLADAPSDAAPDRLPWVSPLVALVVSLPLVPAGMWFSGYWPRAVTFSQQGAPTVRAVMPTPRHILPAVSVLLTTVLIALALVLADRRAGRCPRWLRWMLAAATAGAVPVRTLVDAAEELCTGRYWPPSSSVSPCTSRAARR